MANVKPIVLVNGRLTVIQSGDLIDAAVLPSSGGGGGTGINARVATTANLTLTAPGPTIDGVTMVSGDMVLVKNQTTGSQNGVYTYNGSAAAMTRISALDSSAEAITGLLITVAEGTANSTTVWMLSTYQPITLNTTSLAFTQISQNGTVTISTDVTVDFGLVPTTAKQFTVFIAGLQVGQRVQCVTSGYTPTGVYFDEHEFGVLQWIGKVSTADTLTLLGTSTSPISGQRISQVTAKVSTSQMFITSGQPTVPDFTLQAANII